MKYLIDSGASIAEKNNYGRTSLLCAAFGGHLNIMIELRMKDVFFRERDNGKYTALLLAAEKGHLDVVKWLVNNGAPIKDKTKSNRVHLTGGNTALLLAVKNGHFKVVQYLLLEGGANIKDTNESGQAVFSLASKREIRIFFKRIFESAVSL